MNRNCLRPSWREQQLMLWQRQLLPHLTEPRSISRIVSLALIARQHRWLPAWARSFFSKMAMRTAAAFKRKQDGSRQHAVYLHAADPEDSGIESGDDFSLQFEDEEMEEPPFELGPPPEADEPVIKHSSECEEKLLAVTGASRVEFSSWPSVG